MYVCVCNAVTESDIRREAEAGVRDFDRLQEHTGCATSCGCCEPEARKALREAVRIVHAAIPLTVAA